MTNGTGYWYAEKGANKRAQNVNVTVGTSRSIFGSVLPNRSVIGPLKVEEVEYQTEGGPHQSCISHAWAKRGTSRPQRLQPIPVNLVQIISDVTCREEALALATTEWYRRVCGRIFILETRAEVVPVTMDTQVPSIVLLAGADSGHWVKTLLKVETKVGESPGIRLGTRSSKTFV
jgi:hypothetical protein